MGHVGRRHGVLSHRRRPRTSCTRRLPAHHRGPRSGDAGRGARHGRARAGGSAAEPRRVPRLRSRAAARCGAFVQPPCQDQRLRRQARVARRGGSAHARAFRGARERRRGTRPFRPERAEGRDGVRRPRVRLADVHRAAQQAQRRHRHEAARHGDLRPSDPGRTGRFRPGDRSRHPHCHRRGGNDGGDRRADRRRGHGLPLPRRRGVAGGPVAPGGGRRGRDRRVPRRTAAGTGRSTTRTPDVTGTSYVARWFPARGGRVRPGVLRHLAARGRRDGPAAAAAAGDRVGGPRTRRHRPDVAAGHADRRLRGRHAPRLRARVAIAASGRLRRAPRPAARQRRLRPHRLHARPGGAGGHGRHRLLVVAGGPAPGRAGAALRRVRRWRWPAA